MDPGSRERLIVLDAAASDASSTLRAALTALPHLHPLGVVEVHGLPDPGAAAPGVFFHDVLGEGPGRVLRLGHAPLPPLHDWSDLEPPGPAEHVLAALAKLPPGAVLLARVPRLPRMLAPHLDARGADWAAAARPDGTAVVWAMKAAG